MSENIQGGAYWRDRSIKDTQKDWGYNSSNWIYDYTLSAEHPHRNLIIEALKPFLPISKILEIGCNSGPNLIKINHVFPEIKLSGIDINAMAIAYAKNEMPYANFVVGNAAHLIPSQTKLFDITIADAVFMYIRPDEINQAILEIDRVTKRGIIIVDWYADSLKGKIKDFHWARDYSKLLDQIGYDVIKQKISENIWPSKNWAENGYIFIGRKR